MAREVLAIRLSDDERAALERAAAKGRVTLSGFLRWAGLLVANQLDRPTDTAPPAPAPPPAVPDAPAETERDVLTTYGSFEEYREARYGNGVGIGPGIRKEFL